jgi:hypothetical protein
MQSMGKGRARAYAVVWGFGAIVLGLHIATRDYVRPTAIFQEQVNWRDAHLEIVSMWRGAIGQEPTPRLAVLLGGSNIIYGLSAEMLSPITGTPFFNLGLFKEGYSFDRYLDFVQKSLEAVERQDVDLIVYSTFDFFRSDISGIDTLGFDEAGIATKETGVKVSLLPATPIFTRVQDLFSSTANSYRLQGERGDLNLDHIDCSVGVRLPNEVYDETFAAKFSGILRDRVLRIRDSYPSARIVVSAPARFIAARQLLESEIELYSETLLSHGVEFIVEAPFENESDLCNAAHHPNDAGRTRRTRDLARELIALGIFD